MPLWYSAADLFVYPSIYEGFGLPPLEAMACGTPVIVSDVSSLPEVVGDAGLVVNPREPEALATAMIAVLGHSALAAQMRSKGLARAKQFSWEATAHRTAQYYRDVLETGEAVHA